MQRRGFLGGLLALAAPAIVRTPGLLMAVKPLPRIDHLVYAYTERYGWFPLPPLKQEGRVSAFDPNFTPEEYLVMRMRFADVIQAGIKHLHGTYPEIADAAD